MSFLNKVGNMFTKKAISKQGDSNKYKPAGVHVLGEDYFPSDNINEHLMNQDFRDNEKQPPVTILGSENILPYITQHKNLEQINENQKSQQNKKEESDICKGFILMNGEKKFRTDNCFIKIDDKTFSCKVILTPFRVSIIPDFKKKNPNEFSYMNYFPDNFFSLFIHKIDKSIRTSNDKSFEFSMDIIMKDQRTFSLIFKSGSGGNFLDQLNGLLKLREHSYQNIAIEYRKNNPIYKKENFQEGWDLYNPDEEYERQGVTNLDYEVNKNKLFRKTKLNENYSLCPSYPKFLITVGEITDPDYKYSAEFRAKNRLPALAYYHKITGGTIWRSAQTKSGISGNRNRFDEDLLLNIAKISKKKKLYIYDCRPYLSAVANKLKGAGYENTENYRGSELFFCEIENIHTARNALNKIYSMLKSNRFNENKKFFSNFESSGWPSFIYGIILASVNIVSSVKKGYSVLIHCSDGWDRCSQLTAFSQLLIDPYFRTIKGYMVLIEKDFLSFGHQFKIRNGYYSKDEQNENKTSPILLQFLDATHQLLVQYPIYFEFNMNFLLFIANSINSGLYGTFLYDCDKDREKLNAKNKTMSCWTEILNNISIYKNQFYEENSKKVYFFSPNFSMNRIRLWEEYFFPFTQINLNISYDYFMNRFQQNSYFNVFGELKQKTRIISNVQYMIKEKDNHVKEKEAYIKELDKLKNVIAELTIKNNVQKELFEGLSEDTKNIINNIAIEKGGEINLNVELNKYCFTEVEKPIEIKEEEEPKKIAENKNIILEKKDENKNQEKKENTQNMDKNENKEKDKTKTIMKEEKKENIINQKNEDKKSAIINQSQINTFFGINKKNDIKKQSNDNNKIEGNKKENQIKEELNHKQNIQNKESLEEIKKNELNIERKEKDNTKENECNEKKEKIQKNNEEKIIQNINDEMKMENQNEGNEKKEENIINNQLFNKDENGKNEDNKEFKKEKLEEKENNEEKKNKEEKKIKRKMKIERKKKILKKRERNRFHKLYLIFYKFTFKY